MRQLDELLAVPPSDTDGTVELREVLPQVGMIHDDYLQAILQAPHDVEQQLIHMSDRDPIRAINPTGRLARFALSLDWEIDLARLIEDQDRRDRALMFDE